MTAREVVGEEGYELLVVTLNAVAEWKEDSTLYLLCFDTFVETTDGTRAECFSIVGPQTEDERDPVAFVFALPTGAEGFTFHTPGNDPLILPTPSR